MFKGILDIIVGLNSVEEQHENFASLLVECMVMYNILGMFLNNHMNNPDKCKLLLFHD